MISLQTLTNLEALLMSRSHPLWGELNSLLPIIGEVQAEKQRLSAQLNQQRLQPAPPNDAPMRTEQLAAQAAPANRALVGGISDNEAPS